MLMLVYLFEASKLILFSKNLFFSPKLFEEIYEFSSSLLV